MSSGNVIWFGESATPSLSRVARLLRTERDVEFVVDLGQADFAAKLPALVVIAQSRPGAVSASTIGDIRKRCSHCRVVVLWGEWCCGQKRVDKTLIDPTFGGLESFYTHELQQPADLACLFGSHVGIESSATLSANDLVAIYSPAKSFRVAIGEALSLIGRSWVTLLPGDGVQSAGVSHVLWDVPSEPGRRQTQLDEIRTRHAGASVVGLMTWPREFEVEQLREVGVSVLAQPFSLGQLFAFFRKYGPQSMSSAA